MKKFILSLVLVSAAFIVAFSMPVDPQRAMQMAEQFLPTSQSALHAPSFRKQTAQGTANIVYTHPMPRSGQPAFYIVNVGDGSFAIVSANDIAHPILGYSFSSNFPVSEDGSIQMPPQVKGFLDDLAAQMEAAVEAMPDAAADMDWSQPMRAPRRAGAQVSDSVGPLLTTTWNQTPYYNVLCPEDANSADGHTLTGCVATAIAQIINYWGQPAHGRGTHSYATNYGTLAVDFESSAYDFALMPAALSAVSTQEEINAVAQLMFHCGVAVNMEYGANESSALTQDARAALTDHFGYDASLSLVEKNHFSDAEWVSLLKAELRQNRPIIYTGQGNQGGHTFVCDGYNSNDYFHFNWGWGGLADAWFALSVLDPIGYNFSSSQEAIIGIRPSTATESSVVYGKTSGTSSYTVTVPTTFYHTMGNNGYEGNYNMNPCSNTVTFYAQDENTHLVLDILEMVDQNLSVYDGDFANVLLREFYAGNTADMSPIVSSSNALTLVYNGDLDYSGFRVIVSQHNGCRMVSNVSVSVDTTTVQLTWRENGNATSWEVEYGLAGFSLGEGIRAETADSTITIEGLTELRQYEFYIRSQCGGIWYGPISVMSKIPYWIEVVQSQPSGYRVSVELNDAGHYPIAISSAEGLAWWAKQVKNGAVGVHTDIFLDADIDLQGYLWEPIDEYYGNFNGNGHTISNMTIYEEGNNGDSSGWGFFRMFRGYNENQRHTISNLIFQDPVITILDKSLPSDNTSYVSGMGVIAGRLFCGRILNCGVNNASITQQYARPYLFDGAIVGMIEYSDVMNSYASGTLSSSSKSVVGGLIGRTFWGNKNSTINCYSAIKIETHAPYTGTIFGSLADCEMQNCYGLSDRYPIVGDEVNGIEHVVDTARFSYESLMLSDSIYFDGIGYNNLFTVLNKKVEEINNEDWRVWLLDSLGINNGFPILGDNYVVTCSNVENVVAVNIEKDGDYATRLTWPDEGQTSMWKVKYKEADSLFNTTVYLETDTNYIDIEGLIIGHVYDFSVQKYCDDTHHSGWSSPLQLVFDKPYWTDIVTSKPEGYVEDSDGNAIISSVEGFVWFACLVNGLHTPSNRHKTYNGKTVTLISDIDLSRYKWKPIGNSYDYNFEGTFDGNNHVISNIYVNEQSNNVGLFGFVYQHNYWVERKFSNIIISNGQVSGYAEVGGILGHYHCAEDISPLILFDNCHVNNLTINGNNTIGAIAGYVANSGTRSFINCSSSGDVYGNSIVGGLFGSVGHGLNDTIANCYSLSNIYADNQAGGLVGFAQDCNFINCYAVGISENSDYAVGKLIGHLCDNISCNYLYADSAENSLPLFGEYTIGGQFFIENTSVFSNVGILERPITIGDSNYIDLLSVLNAWVDENNADGNYLHWCTDTARINNGFPIFASLPDYVITFQNYNGAILQMDTLKQGQFPVYTGATPTKPATAQYTYTFKGWDKEVVSVVGVETYTAQFDSIVNTYTISFVDEDGTILQTSDVEYGQVPAYNGATPFKPATGQYTYTFAGWTPEVGAVTAAATYTATYSSTVNQYTITVVAQNGVVTGAGTYDYGTEVTLIATPNEHYHFVQWSDGLTTASRTITIESDATYTALFAIDQFTIDVFAENGTVNGTGTYDYGTEVTLIATPNEGYEFDNWSNGITDNPYTFIVEQDVELTANFIKKFCTSWQDINSEIKVIKYFENERLIIERNGIKYTATGQKVK